MTYVTMSQRAQRRKKKCKRVVAIMMVVAILGAALWGIPKWKSFSANHDALSSLNIPEYSGQPYAVINENMPFFTEEDKTTNSFEYYSQLDLLGRCGLAYANIGRELMPTEERGNIGSVKPTGWIQKKYEGLVNSNPPYLYNRCHLIAYCLTAENANEQNLITGTRYMNVEGMLPFEEQVASFLDEKDYHVLYRVTPVFEGFNLLASGVLMEAYSVEDDGEGICFCV